MPLRDLFSFAIFWIWHFNQTSIDIYSLEASWKCKPPKKLTAPASPGWRGAYCCCTIGLVQHIFVLIYFEGTKWCICVIISHWNCTGIWNTPSQTSRALTYRILTFPWLLTPLRHRQPSDLLSLSRVIWDVPGRAYQEYIPATIQ